MKISHFKQNFLFKNIFENYSKIPDRIRTNPEKIIDYVNAQEKAKDPWQR